MALSRDQRPTLFALDFDVPGPAGVRVEAEAIDVEATYMGIVVGVVSAVAGVVDDLHGAVVAWRAAPATGVCGRRAARGEEQHGDTHEDRYVSSCLAHTSPHCLS